ncbi:TPA: aldo/keto reductase [Enterococcus faecalis]|uniref:aldo/keto reductase n=1 Tax=Enterococcus sp. DIV0086 TaxID=2774655 RepID=UPI002986EFCB|nr:aldo/keto reductase [Enterococcus faecalis]HBI1662563.1 aldo/keto reductase [Enterococcus faecalis]HBI1677726.1 aldo/keto reductase [Enterococcus faecalis]HBI1678278.1 aldo/keto reductase [Enterococcus faecalis]HBI1686314.1 aldo/keto reductase [Enterococcus faecalis]
MIPTIKLNDGNEMPQVGFGVFQIPNHLEARSTVEAALSNGYRLIDTAEAYNNQLAIGEAISRSSTKREDIFLTTKLWVSNFTYEKAKQAIDHDLQELKTDYIDLFLLHQAYGDVAGAWRAMEEAQKAGKIKSLGVSNFWPAQLKNLELMMNVKPVVNQIEVNPWFQRTQEVEWNQKEDVAVEAWAPFAEGKNGIFTNKLLRQIGEKYGKTPGQVILRWLLQRNIILIPKSVHVNRQKENITLFDFELSMEDMNLISTLDRNKSQFFDHHDPDTIEQIFGSSLRELRL